MGTYPGTRPLWCPGICFQNYLWMYTTSINNPEKWFRLKCFYVRERTTLVLHCLPFNCSILSWVDTQLFLDSLLSDYHCSLSGTSFQLKEDKEETFHFRILENLRKFFLKEETPHDRVETKLLCGLRSKWDAKPYLGPWRWKVMKESPRQPDLHLIISTYSIGKTFGKHFLISMAIISMMPSISSVVFAERL